MVIEQYSILQSSKLLGSIIGIDSHVTLKQPYDGYDSFNLSLLGEECCFRSSNFRPRSNASGKHSFLTKGRVSGNEVLDKEILPHRGFNVPLWDRYNGMEDPKLIKWMGNLWCLFVRPNHSISRIEMRMINLDTGESYRLKDPLSRQYSKNWMPLVIGERLLFVTDVDPLRVYEFSGGNLSPVHIGSVKKHDALIHGGSNIIRLNGSLIGLVHGRFEMSEGEWVYWHAVAHFSDSLDDVVIGRPFYFEGRQIEFSLSMDVDSKFVKIPYSVDDATMSIVSVRKEELGALL